MELEGDTDDPTFGCNRIRGLSLTDGDRLLYQADPGIEDPERIVGSEVEPSFAPSRSGGPATATPSLPVSELVPIFRSAVLKTKKLHPDATIKMRWAGFDQRIRVARPEREVVVDRRWSGRLRIEARSRSSEALAVAEAVFPPDKLDETGIPESLAEEVAARLERRAGATSLPPGERRVVFAPGVGGVLIHEIVGHALEADTVSSEMSWLAGAGDRVAAGELRVVDDPRRGRAPWRYDDEGEEARPTPLIDRGRVAGQLHDLASAVRSGSRPTGHGRRASFREPVKPRMGCTFVAPGPLHPQEVLKEIGDGIYVRRMEAASTDPLSGRAVFRVTDSDHIHAGRLDAPLVPHLMHVDARATLPNVELIASDLAFDRCIGSCLRDGQPLVISVGGPTFCIGLTTVLF